MQYLIATNNISNRLLSTNLASLEQF